MTAMVALVLGTAIVRLREVAKSGGKERKGGSNDRQTCAAGAAGATGAGYFSRVRRGRNGAVAGGSVVRQLAISPAMRYGSVRGVHGSSNRLAPEGHGAVMKSALGITAQRHDCTFAVFYDWNSIQIHSKCWPLLAGISEVAIYHMLVYDVSVVVNILHNQMRDTLSDLRNNVGGIANGPPIQKWAGLT